MLTLTRAPGRALRRQSDLVSRRDRKRCPLPPDISHGELPRASNDQTLTASPCGVRYIYHGLDPGAGGDYNGLRWRLGLLTQTNSTC